MAGGTTFHLVTDGFDAAFEQATAVAEGRGVDTRSTLDSAAARSHLRHFTCAGPATSPAPDSGDLLGPSLIPSPRL
jgi:hypothetical protein